MKKLYSICFSIFMVLFSIGINAQSKKIVLFEHFTQASCGPCASQNPLIRPIVEANADKLAIIHHQVNWPGYDPMNEQNPGDVRARVDYYRVSGVPSTVMDGTKLGSPSSIVTQANIDQKYNQVSPLTLNITGGPSPAFDGLDFSLSIQADETVSGNLYAHVVVIEEVIQWNSPPGSNGERVFHNVLKKSLPTAAGTTLGSELSQGSSQSLDFSYKFENFYDFRNAGVVAFIQDRTTKQVYQAIHWRPDFTPHQGDDIAIQQVNAAGVFGKDFVCGNSTSPIITVMNTGNTSITQFEAEYSVNGSAPMVYQWSGAALAPLQSRDITLPEIQFEIKEIGEITATVQAPNGQADVVEENGSAFSEFLPAPRTTTTCEFRIRPLTRPEDVTFRILDDAGTVILEGGPLQDRTTQTYPLTLDADRCYTAEVTNNSINLNATFQIYDEYGERVFSGVATGEGTFTEDFNTYAPVANVDITEIAHWQISPNPVLSSLNIDVEVGEALDATVEVYDGLGHVYLSKKAQWNDGQHRLSLDCSKLKAGVYFVGIRSNSGFVAQKWIKL